MTKIFISLFLILSCFSCGKTAINVLEFGTTPSSNSVFDPSFTSVSTDPNVVYDSFIYGAAYDGIGVYVSAARNIIQRSTDGTTWTKVYTFTPTATTTLNNTYFGNGLFFVMGTGGLLMSSSDGITWTTVSTPTTNSIISMVYGGGQYIAVGSGSLIMTSPDGANWTSQTANVGALSFFDVAYNPGMGESYVVVGWSGAIESSNDGVTWNARTPGGFNGTTIYRGVTYGNGMYIAVGQSADIQASADGITWTEEASDAGFVAGFRDIAFSAGTFVAVGETGEIETCTQTSANIGALTWTTRANATGTITELDRVSVINGNFLLTGGALMQSSPNGIAWASVTPAGSSTNYQINAIASDGAGTYVLVTSAAGGGVQTSTDGGVTWLSRTLDAGFNGTITDIAYGNGVFVVVGTSGEIQSSTDGLTWTQRSNFGAYAGTFMEIIYAANLFVTIGSTNGEIQTSSNGSAWTKQAAAGGYANAYTSISYANGEFWLMAAAPSAIHKSTNGTAWSVFGGYTPIIALVRVAYGNGVYIGVSGAGVVATSNDGVSWTENLSVGGADNFYDIVYAEGGFVASRQNSRLVKTLDGITWSDVTIDSATTFLDIHYDGTRFLGGGSYGQLRVSN